MLQHFVLLVTRSTKEIMQARTTATRLKNQGLDQTKSLVYV